MGVGMLLSKPSGKGGITTKYGNKPGQISTFELFMFCWNPNYKGMGVL